MKCSCGGETRVVDSRLLDKALRRRRTCMECGNRFSTLETAIPEVERKPKPVKKDPAYTPAEVAAKIKQKKTHARRQLEDMRYAKEDTDIFDLDEVSDFDEDIPWIPNL
jgi:transcriptional regulator NrdR family protein